MFEVQAFGLANPRRAETPKEFQMLFSRQFELPQVHPQKRHRCRNPRTKPVSASVDTNVRTLFVGKRRVLQIERDAKYPQMWRVRLPDGSLSDMVNLTRAKEAALNIAEGIEARKTPHKSPLKSLKDFSWSRPPAAPPSKPVLRPSKPPEIAPAAKSTSEEIVIERGGVMGSKLVEATAPTPAIAAK
jgi:hypothetical protein